MNRRSVCRAVTLVLLCALVCAGFGGNHVAKGAAGDVKISTTFTDDVFRKYVEENFDKNGDKILSRSEAAAVTEIKVAAKGIRSLDGISVFTKLKKLDCAGNSLTSLVLTANTELEFLNCSNNNLKTIDLSKNTKLKSVYCSMNQLTTLDLSYCPNATDVVTGGINNLIFIAVTRAPSNVTVDQGENASFSVTARGAGPLKYQWQVFDEATGKWKNSVAASAKTANFSFKTQQAHDGMKFHCVITDAKGRTITTDEVTLTVNSPITEQPRVKLAPVGSAVDFRITVKNPSAYTYQWQALNPNSQRWVDSTAPGNKTAKLTLTVLPGHNGFKFRCVVTDTDGNVTVSKAARLSTRPEIITYPSSRTVSVGETAQFTISARGSGTLLYQWEVYDAATDTWKDCTAASAKTATFRFTAQRGHNGKIFRCRVSSDNGGTTISIQATLTVR